MAPTKTTSGMNTDFLQLVPNTLAAKQLEQYAFTLADCQEFGRYSGDLNPLHIDELYARKSIAGICVVHGVLVLLRALESAFAVGVPKPSRINAQFRKFVCVGEEVHFSLSRKEGKNDSLQLSASVGSRRCVDVTLSFAPAQPPSPSAENQTFIEWMATPGTQERPLDALPSQQFGKAYATDLHQFGLLSKFPNCEKILGGSETKALCASTYFVGMICPGLNSIYSALDLEIFPSAANPLTQYFFLDKFDERSGRFEISTKGILAGKITAFRRPEVVVQEAISAYQGKVRKGEFSHINALVIGGSRGLGAAAAKILALGGANVGITFSKGKTDAEGVAAEIEGACGSKTSMYNFDLIHDELSVLKDPIARANVLLYFATPKIRTGKLKGMDKELYDQFFQFYVEKLLELSLFLEGLKQNKKIIYVPSSIFVESRPRAHLEYAMAKSAAEILCGEINLSFSHVRTVTTRLPRLKTDQSASLYDLKYEPIFDNLYSVLSTISESLR